MRPSAITIIVGFIFLLASIIYGSVATAFYGFHLMPESSEEILVDGFTLVIAALGALIFCVGLLWDDKK